MHDLVLKVCLFTATAFTGLLCGASLDQSIKQLPARRRIGVKMFSAYAKAADLKNGVVWYAILGIGSALTSIITAAMVWISHATALHSTLIIFAAVFGILHSLCTSIAAPTYHKQKKVTEENELEVLFNKFERVQAFRSVFIALNFLCLMAAIWLLH